MGFQRKKYDPCTPIVQVRRKGSKPPRPPRSNSTPSKPPAKPNPYHCPNCQSAQTKRVSSLYSKGVSTIHFDGYSYSLSGRPTYTSGYGQYVNQFSRRIAPPARSRSLMSTITVIALGYVALYIIATTLAQIAAGHPGITIVLVGLTFLVGVHVVRRTLREHFTSQQTRELRDRLRLIWGEAWMCRRCEHIFVPGDNSPETQADCQALSRFFKD